MFGIELQWDQLQALLLGWGLKLLIAAIIFFVGRGLAKFFRNIIQNYLTKSNMDEMLVSFLGNIFYALALTFVIIAALSKLGINTTSLAAILAAAGLAIGLALQGSLSNFASGVMLIIFRPFHKGDFIDAAGNQGVVSEISIFTTTMKSGDNKVIIIPNSAITSGAIINYSAEEKRRIDLVFGCGYDDDLQKVKSVLERLVAADDRILKDPEATIAVAELGASSVDFVVRPWVKTEDYWAVRFDLTEAVKKAFDEEGLSIPYPQQDVHMHQKAA